MRIFDRDRTLEIICISGWLIFSLIVVTTTYVQMLFSEANTNSTIQGPLFLRKSVFITFSLKLVLTRRMYSISVCAMSSLIEYLLRDAFCHKKLYHCFYFFFLASALSRVGSARATFFLRGVRQRGVSDCRLLSPRPQPCDCRTTPSVTICWSVHHLVRRNELATSPRTVEKRWMPM